MESTLVPSPIHFRIAGFCALVTAGCAIAGGVVSLLHDLGGQNLPVETPEQISFLVSNRAAYLVREWLYLLLAVFALGEGVGLYYLLRKSPLAIWALVAWLVGLTIGIIEDSAVIALIGQVAQSYPDAPDTLRSTIQFTAKLTFETIQIQQCIAILLCSTISYPLFSIMGYRAGKIPLWLCLVGVLSGVTTGGFAICNVVPSLGPVLPLCENGFALMVVWDLSVGLILLSQKRVD